MKRIQSPVPVVPVTRTFPAISPLRITPGEPFPERVLLTEVAIDGQGRATSGVYLGDGPDMTEVAGRFLGRAAPLGFEPPGPGPLRDLEDYLDRPLWRLIYESRFGFVAWDLAALAASLAFEFRKGGRWVVLWTYLDARGERKVDYYRPPVVLDSLANAQVAVKFGPRKRPNPRDYVAPGRQNPGRFLPLRGAASALAGERVEHLTTACRLFDVSPPPAGPARPETLPGRIAAMRDLYRAVRREAESWPT
jgi:hypothetical protein